MLGFTIEFMSWLSQSVESNCTWWLANAWHQGPDVINTLRQVEITF